MPGARNSGRGKPSSGYSAFLSCSTFNHYFTPKSRVNKQNLYSETWNRTRNSNSLEPSFILTSLKYKSNRLPINNYRLLFYRRCLKSTFLLLFVMVKHVGKRFLFFIYVRWSPLLIIKSFHCLAFINGQIFIGNWLDDKIKLEKISILSFPINEWTDSLLQSKQSI